MLAAAGCTQLKCLPWHFCLLTSSILHTRNVFSLSMPLPQRLKTRADFAVCAQRSFIFCFQFRSANTSQIQHNDLFHL